MSILIRMIAGNDHVAVITTQDDGMVTTLEAQNYPRVESPEGMYMWAVPADCVSLPAMEAIDFQTVTYVEFGDDQMGKITIGATATIYEDDLDFGQAVKQWSPFDEDQDVPW